MSPEHLLRAGAEAADREAHALARAGEHERAVAAKAACRILCAIADDWPHRELREAGVELARALLRVNDRRAAT